jgi:hypothetical protein
MSHPRATFKAVLPEASNDPERCTGTPRGHYSVREGYGGVSIPCEKCGGVLHCPECGHEPDDCPICLGHDVQVSGLERDLRTKRGALTKLERAAERETVKRRDGAVWNRILSAWLEAFPDKKPSATSVKSARATATFLRLQSGATEDDFLAAIRGAREYPYVVYGKRQRKGSRSDLADDLQHIAAINRDHEFEFLRDVGRVFEQCGGCPSPTVCATEGCAVERGRREAA